MLCNFKTLIERGTNTVLMIIFDMLVISLRTDVWIVSVHLDILLTISKLYLPLLD